MIRRIVEGRAARTCAAAVAVFLCTLTLLEFTALELEWEIPVLQVVSGEDSFWSVEYQREELALDDSAENVLLEEPGSGAAAAGDESADGETAGSAGAAGEESAGVPGGAGSGETAGEEGAGAPGGAGSGETAGGEGAGAPGGAGSGDTAGGEGEGAPGTAGNAENGEGTGGETAGDGAQTADGTVETEFPYYIRVNRKQNCITVYTLDENGEYTVPYKAIVCSTGLYNATPRGTFQLSTKYLWRELYGGVYGQYATRIHGGVLFHSVPYYRKSKDSLCTDKYNKLGQQASMGCIRLTVEDAKWIAENCPSGTTVEIYDDDDPGPLGKPAAMKLDPDSPNKGWDPTDPDEDNPWNDLSRDE